MTVQKNKMAVTLTFKEVLESLKQVDEVTLLEVLDISSEDIVDRFEDKVDERYEKALEVISD